MNQDISLLTATAAFIGIMHTLLGPDHYVPFIVLARSNRWPFKKTARVTLLCGLAHILSSIILGLIGIAFTLSISNIEALEAFRGNLAGWALIAFGLVYFAWGLKKAYGPNQLSHDHEHTAEFPFHKKKSRPMTPWVLFLIFAFGPCEPLIPLLMYPAAKSSIVGVVVVTAVFGLATVLTMLGVVALSLKGLGHINFHQWERYTHAVAGAAICFCGVSIQFLGL